MSQTSVSPSQAAQLRAAIGSMRHQLSALTDDGCDRDDIEALLSWAERELAKPLPNTSTLAVPLNSVARSLAAEPASRAAVLTLDAAMREAGITTSWEH